MSSESRKQWLLDFEGDIPQQVRVGNAVVTNDPAWIIEGEGSLVCDTRKSGKEWNEFLVTDPSRFTLIPGHIYRVSFEYRAIDPGDNSYYCLMRPAGRRQCDSLDQMAGFQLKSQSWSGGMSDQSVLCYSDKYSSEFQIPSSIDSYYLIIGIHNKAVLVVDNLLIEDMGMAGELQAGKIKSGFAVPYQPEIDALMAYREKYKVAERYSHVRIPCRDEGTTEDSLIARFHDELHLDYNSWWFGAPTGGKYGVRCGRGGAEYNGYYRVEAPAYWDNRYEYFRGHGFVESLDDSCSEEKYWGEGGYQTCQNGDRWHNIQHLSMAQWLPTFDDVSQDNLTWCSFYMDGCYCAGCREMFRDYMKKHYSLDEMKRLGKGITDIEVFDMRRYINDHLGRPTGFDILSDPVLREYIKFQNLAHFSQLLDHFTAFSKLGEEQSRGIGMYGNQNAIATVANAAAISPLCDVLEVECGDDEDSYVIARGSGLDEKQVWTRGISNTKPFGVALTFGGFKNMSLWWKSKELAKNPDEAIETSPYYPIYKAYADYINGNRALYGKQRGYTKVALVWSLPSLMWRSYPPLGLNTAGQRAEFIAMSQLMIDNNVTFDCVLFYHPEMYDDKDFLARLNEYDTVILPNVDCLSQAQADALKQMSRNGKRIIAYGELGTRDENFNRLDRGKGIKTVRPGSEAELIGLLQVDNPLRVHPAIANGKAPRFSATAFQRLGGKAIVVNLLNRDNDNKMLDAPWSGPVTAQIRIPEGLPYDIVYAISWEHEQIALDAKAINPPVGAGGGKWIEVVIPKVQHYTAIVLGNKAEIDKVNGEELAWIAAEKEQVKKDFQTRQEWYITHGWPEKIMP